MTVTSPEHSKEIWLMAGEASGDILGARLMVALRKQMPSLRFRGIGGVHMQAQGLESIFPMSDLAVMGLVEILPKIRHLSRRLSEAVADIEKNRPDLVLTIDSPGFALRLLRRIKNLGILRVHYVAPQVWAWREHRVREFPGLWDRLLCLLPFEVEFFEKHGLEARFVGHSVLQSGADGGNARRFRAKYSIQDDAPVLILMPGSRRSEVPRLLPVFEKMLVMLKRRLPNIVPVIPVSPVVSQSVRATVAKWDIVPVIVTEVDDKHDAFAAAGAALTKSGTSTLELALADVPMVVTYRVNRLTAAIARRLIRVPYVAMINLLAGREIVPELLQEKCRPDLLAQVVEALLSNPAKAQQQRDGFRSALSTLQAVNGSPADAAAAEIIALLNAGSGT